MSQISSGDTWKTKQTIVIGCQLILIVYLVILQFSVLFKFLNLSLSFLEQLICEVD